MNINVKKIPTNNNIFSLKVESVEKIGFYNIIGVLSKWTIFLKISF